MILSLGLIDCVDDIGFHRSAFFDGPFWLSPNNSF